MSKTGLKFNVSYYDSEDEKALELNSLGKRFSQIVTTGFAARKGEFLVYATFDEQKNLRGWRNFKELKKSAASSIPRFKNYFDVDGHTVRARFKGREYAQSDITEDAGVAASLALMNEVLGLTEADWQKVAVGATKGTDYRIASTGSAFIQVEAKGAVVDRDEKCDTVYSHAHSIRRKKESLRTNAFNRDLLVGIIAAFPHAGNELARCYLLDPPFDRPAEDPKKFSLLARLRFYHRNLSLIDSSALMGHLINRIKQIERVKDYSYFDGKPLFSPKENESDDYDYKRRLGGKTWLGDDIVGEVFPLGKDDFCFFGLELDLFDLMLNQTFDRIWEFRSQLGWDEKAVRDISAVLDVTDLQALGIPLERMETTNDPGKVATRLTGTAYSTNAGRVIGLLKYA